MSRLLEDWMMGRHGDFDACFRRHQVALIDRDHRAAGAELARYQQLLDEHIAQEEAHVIPLHVAHGGDATDAPAKLFLGEHQLIRKFLAEFRTRVERLVAVPDDDQLLELLDREATFKNLMLHHDLRERNVLYPRLSERLGEAEQAAVLARIRGG